MTPYREILRLHSRGISQRDIAASCQCSRNTITRVVTRAKELSLAWPLKEDLTDGDLEKTFFPDLVKPSSSRRHAGPGKHSSGNGQAGSHTQVALD